MSRVVILCGGRGTRLQEHTPGIPKPLVEIGSHPILWHVMQIYAVQGLRRFVLCTGYKGELIEQFVSESDWDDDVDVRCVEERLEVGPRPRGEDADPHGLATSFG